MFWCKRKHRINQCVCEVNILYVILDNTFIINYKFMHYIARPIVEDESFVSLASTLLQLMLHVCNYFVYFTSNVYIWMSFNYTYTKKSKWISNKKSIYCMMLMRLPYLPVSLFINLSIQLELLNNHEGYGDETTSAMLHYTEVRITICIFHFICGFVPTPFIMYSCTHGVCASRWLKSIVYVCN